MTNLLLMARRNSPSQIYKEKKKLVSQIDEKKKKKTHKSNLR